MQTRIARIEAIIPSLAKREDLAHLEGRMRSAIQSVENTLHQELTSQTLLIDKMGLWPVSHAFAELNGGYVLYRSIFKLIKVNFHPSVTRSHDVKSFYIFSP